MSKQRAIFNYLLTGAKITPIEALNYFDCFSLSQTLGELRRKKGIPVLSELVKTPTGAHHSCYWLDKSYIEKVRKGEITPKI